MSKNPYQTHTEADMKADARYARCPHCGMHVYKAHLAQHTAVCIRLPAPAEMVAYLRAHPEVTAMKWLCEAPQYRDLRLGPRLVKARLAHGGMPQAEIERRTGRIPKPVQRRRRNNHACVTAGKLRNRCRRCQVIIPVARVEQDNLCPECAGERPKYYWDRL